MDSHRLTRDELLYELAVRGVDDIGHETVGAMRRRLSELIRTEEFGDLVFSPTFRLVVETEMLICTEKIAQLYGFVQSRRSIAKNSTEERNVETKLRHLYGRVSRVRLRLTEEERAQMADRLTNLFNQLGSIEVLVDSKLDATVEPNDPNVQPPTVPLLGAQVVNIHKHQVPVCQWGLKFSGNKQGMSVNAFLERVEELRVARGVSEVELLNSIVDLLEDQALIWYRSVKTSVLSWTGFVRELRKEFLLFDYATELWQEIRTRVQGPNESVGSYFACLKNLFNRLSVPPSEEEKLRVLQRNLAPYLIQGIGLVDISSVDQLLDTCKKLETVRILATAPRPNVPKASCLEPDLAGPTLVKSRMVAQTSSVGSILCWNCRGSGHYFSQCRAPRNGRFCFKCGKRDVTTSTCQCRNAARLSGNGQRNH
ncbi:uncharacterized protein LOC135123513 [Zophobas morio]|uniref:uncharacterized protein LOC135123513 n=1 Tax=Zophobas morio TaxID=2755281 RepID=UPI0030836A7F